MNRLPGEIKKKNVVFFVLFFCIIVLCKFGALQAYYTSKSITAMGLELGQLIVDDE